MFVHSWEIYIIYFPTLSKLTVVRFLTMNHTHTCANICHSCFQASWKFWCTSYNIVRLFTCSIISSCSFLCPRWQNVSFGIYMYLHLVYTYIVRLMYLFASQIIVLVYWRGFSPVWNYESYEAFLQSQFTLLNCFQLVKLLLQWPILCFFFSSMNHHFTSFLPFQRSKHPLLQQLWFFLPL